MFKVLGIDKAQDFIPQGHISVRNNLIHTLLYSSSWQMKILMPRSCGSDAVWCVR